MNDFPFQLGRFAASSRHSPVSLQGIDVCVRLAVHPSALSGPLELATPREGAFCPTALPFETSQVTSAPMSLDTRMCSWQELLLDLDCVGL